MVLKATDRLPIGELAQRTGIAVSAIRYYEEQGLIASERNAGGQRRFLRSDIRRLSFILIAQQFGFTLPQIREVWHSCRTVAPRPRPTGRGSAKPSAPSSTARSRR